ncbi:MAG: glycoside hydrolase [Phycisphaerales bacterium]|nr:glycoside hydrolase [Phycisphaerales bacterium]
MHTFLSLTVLFVALATAPAWSQSAEVFTSGPDGYHTFRIPALITTGDGTLLAFAEGRRGGRGDAGDIDLVLRRSTDGGATWGPLAVIWDDEANTCGNPCPVLDRTTGTVHLLMTRNLGTDTEQEIINQTSEDARTVWTATSADHGATWAKPREITATAKAPAWTWYATGPGNGIQLRSGEHAGRMIIPCDHIEAGTKKYFSHVIVSDDHGKTWRMAGTTPTDQVNECAVAELEDGTLLLNMRNYNRKNRTRALARSTDAGETWSPVSHHPDLPEPICQASMIATEDGRRLVFSNPASSDGRIAMTVKESRDGGRSWTTLHHLHAGPAAYSSLAETASGDIACLYEAGEQHPYESIRFEILPSKARGGAKSD